MRTIFVITIEWCFRQRIYCFPKRSPLSNSLFICFLYSCYFHRLQRGNIGSVNIRRGAQIWQNSNGNLFIVFEILWPMDDRCVLCERIHMASNENLFGCLAKGLDGHWTGETFYWCLYYIDSRFFYSFCCCPLHIHFILGFRALGAMQCYEKCIYRQYPTSAIDTNCTHSFVVRVQWDEIGLFAFMRVFVRTFMFSIAVPILDYSMPFFFYFLSSLVYACPMQYQ